MRLFKKKEEPTIEELAKLPLNKLLDSGLVYKFFDAISLEEFIEYASVNKCGLRRKIPDGGKIDKKLFLQKNGKYCVHINLKNGKDEYVMPDFSLEFIKGLAEEIWEIKE